MKAVVTKSLALVCLLHACADALAESGLTNVINGVTNNTTIYMVGTNGELNALIVTNAGVLISSAGGVVGNSVISSNNAAWVTGFGSLWTNTTGGLLVGAFGSLNSLTIADGGRVRGTVGYIGSNTVAWSNSVVISGAGAVWTNTGALSVGQGGSWNTLTISTGGVALCSTGYIGNAATASNNAALVTGTGAYWSVNGNLFVGSTGAFNSLTIAAGGAVWATNVVMGNSALSTGNVITLSGGDLSATNAGGRGALYVRRGTLTLNSGVLTVNRFYATNGSTSAIVFNGGTFHSGGSAVSNGSVFAVGDGVSVATLNLMTGVHQFADGIRIAANGAVTNAFGNTGTLTTPLLVNAGLFQVIGGTSLVTTLTNSATFIQNSGVVVSAFFDNANFLQMLGGTNQDAVFLNQASGRILHSDGRHDAGVATNRGFWNLSGSAVAALTNLIVDAGGGFTNAGGTLIATNAFGLGLIDVLNGNLTLNSGTTMVDRFFATNSAASRINFNGGMLTGGTGTIQNGGRLQVGGGTGIVGALINASTFDQSGGLFGSGLFDNSAAFTLTGGTNMSSLFFNQTAGRVAHTGGEQHAGVATNRGAWNVWTGVVANLTNLIVDGGGGFTNTGAMLTSTNASAQGRIDVLNGTLTLNSGTTRVDRFFATNGVTSRINFNGGTLAARAGTILNGGQFQMIGGSGTVGALVNGSVFNQFGGRFISASFNNSGAFTLTGGTNQGGPFFNEAGGRVQHTGGELAVNFATNSGAWNLLGGAVANITNLIVDGGGGFTNTGAMLTSTNQFGQGRIDVRDGTLALNTGTIRVDRLYATNALSGFIRFNNGTLTGGVATILNAGQFLMSNGVATFAAMTNGGTFNQAGGRFVTPAFDNSGLFVLTKSTNFSSVFANQAGGRVQHDSGRLDAEFAANAGAWSLSSGAVANLTNLTVDGGGGLTNAGALLNSTNPFGQGRIDVLNGTLTLNSGTIRVDRLFATNAGSLVNFNGGILTGTVATIQGGQFLMTGGTGIFAAVTNAGTFNQAGRHFYSLSFDNSGAFGLAAGTNVSRLFINRAGGRVQQTGGAHNALTATNRGAWTLLAGAVANLTNLTVDGGGGFTNAGGRLTSSNALGLGLIDVRSGRLTLNSGTVVVNRLTATNGVGSAITFNGGTLDSAGTAVQNGSLFRVGNGVANATLHLAGGTHSFANGLFINTNATLTGTGAITGAISSSGTISPGDSVGILTGSSSLTLLPNGQLVMEMAGTDESLLDQIRVAGTLAFGGALNVSLLGYTPQLGDWFDLFDFATGIGSFNQVNLPALGAGLYWDTEFLYSMGGLLVGDADRAWMVSPSNGTVFTSDSATFLWARATPVSQYRLWVGSTPGGSDIYAGVQTGLTRTVTLPIDGRPIYVDLYAWVGGAWQLENSYTYTAATITKAQMLSPVDGSTLASASTTFIWDNGGGVTQYALWVGSNPMTWDIYAGFERGQSRRLTLPTDGRTIYVTLWSWINGAWQSNAYTYTAYTPPPTAKAQMLYPAAGSTINGGAARFIWDTGVGVTTYALWVGTSPMTWDLYAAIETGQSRRLTLPTDGRTIYVTLWSWINGAWQSNAYTYVCGTAPAPAPTPAQMLTPTPGTTLASAVTTFIWDDRSWIGNYMLWVGSSPMGRDVYEGVENAQSRTLTLPTDGRTLYVTLWSWVNGAWQASQYTYTACGRPMMLAPRPGTKLPGASTLFIWDAYPGVTTYALWVGSGPMTWDLYAAVETGQSRRLTLPTDGRTIYVTLWLWLNGAWRPSAYTYSAFGGP